MTTIVTGVIDGIDALPKFTVLSIAVEVKLRDRVESKIYPVKYFGERAKKFNETPAMRGRTFESTCYVDSWQANSGTWYVSLNGGDYKLGEPPKPTSPPPIDDDIVDDLPF